MAIVSVEDKEKLDALFSKLDVHLQQKRNKKALKTVDESTFTFWKSFSNDFESWLVIVFVSFHICSSCCVVDVIISMIEF